VTRMSKMNGGIFGKSFILPITLSFVSEQC
jgi:hypothetical protein